MKLISASSVSFPLIFLKNDFRSESTDKVNLFATNLRHWALGIGHWEEKKGPPTQVDLSNSFTIAISY
jgi:hypothetical protein